LIAWLVFSLVDLNVSKQKTILRLTLIILKITENKVNLNIF
jgi:hypothetical protein